MDNLEVLILTGDIPSILWLRRLAKERYQSTFENKFLEIYRRLNVRLGEVGYYENEESLTK